MDARGYLQLVRPANVLTAAADVVAGFAVAGATDAARLAWLVGASAALYAGGITLNDVFDHRTDARDRPERPIPSGRVPLTHAAGLGSALLTLGVLAGAQAGPSTGLIAVVLAGSVLIYDAAAKHSAFAGPLTMGACRGLNFMLGLAAAPEAWRGLWPLALLSTAYIAGITLLSQEEIRAVGRGKAPIGLTLVGVSILTLGGLAILQGSRGALAVAITAWLAWRVLPPVRRAVLTRHPDLVRKAVRQGILSLVLLDAALAAAYAGPGAAAAVLMTGLAAGYLARFFAVT